MMDLKSFARGAVEAGAALLTVVKPDWLDHMPLDLSKLNFMDPDKCPLFYAFGDYLVGSRVLSQRGYTRQGNYGFALPDELANLKTIEMLSGLDAINQEWRRVIAERRGDQS